MLNKDELILDKVRSIAAHDLETGILQYRLTSVEEPNITVTAESEQVLDAVGSVIATMYHAKAATISGTNSLLHFGLLASQYGTKKQVAGYTDLDPTKASSTSDTITDYTYEILEIASGAVKLKHKASGDINFIYSVESGEVGTAYIAGAVSSATEFVQDDSGATTVITVPTGLTGKVYVEYKYETTDAFQIVNKTSEFPKNSNLVIYAYFRDKCNDDIKYSGKIICPKAKLDPTSIETTLTSTGKHPFTYILSKDYCDETDELFTIIVSNE